MTPTIPKPRATARPWTPEQEDRVRRLRASGLLWEAVGEEVGRDDASCHAHITRHLGENNPLTGPVVARPRRPKAPPPASSAKILRGAMDAGDRVSWGAITTGTLLDGCVYRASSGVMGLPSKLMERGR